MRERGQPAIHLVCGLADDKAASVRENVYKTFFLLDKAWQVGL